MITEHSANGDADRYPCPHCPSEHALAELLDHIDIAHPNLEVTR